MPISSVFRQSFPNPFHGPSQKNRPRHGHIREVSVASFASTSSIGSIVVISVPAAESTCNAKQPRINESNSNTDASLSRATSAAIDAPTYLDDFMSSVNRAESSNMNVMKGSVGESQGGPEKPSSSGGDDGGGASPISNLSTPTSASFSPSFLSPNIRSPSSPSTPTTPFLASDSFLLPPSPTLLSPTMPGERSLGKRFGSIFSNHGSKGGSDDQVASLQVNESPCAADPDKQTQQLKKKRLSAGSISLSVPIGTFLSHAFRHKQHQQHQQQEQQEQQEHIQSTDPPKRKKRRNLLPKLPRLDTRPKITVSAETTTAGASFPSGGPVRRRFMKATSRKTKESQEREIVASLDQRDIEESATPGTEDEGGAAVAAADAATNPAAEDFLSPFYLPAQFRPGSSALMHSRLESISDDQQPPSPTEEEFLDWRRYSEVYYDDRWDRASVRTVDSETMRLSVDDPYFPGYPERNDYWQQHCRIRERRWKQQLQKHQQQLQTEARSPASWTSRARGNTEEETESILEEDDIDGELSERLQNATLNMNSVTTDQTDLSASAGRGRQQRVRYTSYSAYAAAMQLKSKSRTDRKQPTNAFIAGVGGGNDHPTGASASLIQARSLGRNHVGPMPDHPKEAVLGGASVGSGDVDIGSISARRRRQPDSGILFVASTATTAEVYPALHHDPQALLSKNFRSDFKKDLCESNDAIHGAGVLSEDELMIGCLVASYFDKRVLKRVESEYHVKQRHKGIDMEGRQKEELIDDENADALVGNGFMMLQSSFGDQGSLDALSGRSSTLPNPVYPSCTPSTPSNSCTTPDLKNTINNNYINNKAAVDLCLSQPGQYSSHNHILPLHQLLEQEEQERQRQQRQNPERQCPNPAQSPDGRHLSHGKNVSSSSDESTLTSRPSTPSSHLLLGSVASSSTSPSTSPTLPKHGYFETLVPPQEHIEPTSSAGGRGSSGHMLLMLCDGRFQYYKNGTRKRGLQWDDDYDMDGVHDNAVFSHETNVILEEDEEDPNDREHNELKEEAVAVKGKGVDRSVHQTEEQAEKHLSEGHEESTAREPIPASNPSPDAAKHSKASSSSFGSILLSTSTLPRTASTSSYTSPPPRTAASSSRLATLGSVRGSKSRPSVSYSVLPGLASIPSPPSLSSLASTNGSSTLLSSSTSQLTHYLRHQGSSGAMTTRTTTTLNTSSTAAGTPTTGLSSSNLAQFPALASTLPSDTLAKPTTVAFLQSKQQKRDEEIPPQRSLSLSTSPHNALDDAVSNADHGLHSEAAVLAATRRPARLLSLPGTATSSLSLPMAPSPKEWLRKAFPSRQGSISSTVSSPASSSAQRSTLALTTKTSTLLAAAAATKDLLETRMADEEMEQDLWEDPEDDYAAQEDEHLVGRESRGKDGGRSPAQQRRADSSHPSQQATRPRHQLRALSMVELSTSKPSPTTRRHLCKSNALTSTSTVITLESSHGLYQWNEFFDM